MHVLQVLTVLQVHMLLVDCACKNAARPHTPSPTCAVFPASALQAQLAMFGFTTMKAASPPPYVPAPYILLARVDDVPVVDGAHEHCLP